MTSNPTAVLEKYRDDFRAVLPTTVRADQWLRLTTGLFRRNRHLAEILRNNPGSVLSALLNAARLGLEPGEHYHLVPFKNEVVGIIDYRGHIDLMYRSGKVASVKAEVVYARDHFRFDSSMDRPEHRPDWFGDRGEAIGAFAYADLKDGATSRVIVRSRAEIERVQASSRAASSDSSPWKQWPDRMYLKTVLRELSKFVPSSPEDLTRPAAAPDLDDGVRQTRPIVEPLPDALGTTEVIEYADDPPVDVDTGEILDPAAGEEDSP